MLFLQIAFAVSGVLVALVLAVCGYHFSVRSQRLMPSVTVNLVTTPVCLVTVSALDFHWLRMSPYLFWWTRESWGTMAWLTFVAFTLTFDGGVLIALSRRWFSERT